MTAPSFPEILAEWQQARGPVVADAALQLLECLRDLDPATIGGPTPLPADPQQVSAIQYEPGGPARIGLREHFQPAAWARALGSLRITWWRDNTNNWHPATQQ